MQTKQALWLVLDSRGNGGIETHVRELARGIDDAGLAVSVVFLEDHGSHPLRAALSDAGIDNFALDGRLRSLLAALRARSPALIHSHGYKAGLYCSIAALATGIDHATTFHSGDPGRGRVALYDWLHRQSARRTTLNFCVSREIAARVPAPCHLLPNFIRLPQAAGHDAQQIAFVGRLSYEKGPDRLLQIAAQLPGQLFDIYGGGDLMTSLVDTAPRNCRFHGEQPDMNARWNDIDLLLLPSRHEGLPLVVLEAMARGIPVVAFNVGAVAEVVLPGENGWLVEAGDTTAFKSAIECWLALDPCRRQAMRESARQRIERNFSTGKVLPMILDAYRLANHSPALAATGAGRQP